MHNFVVILENDFEICDTDEDEEHISNLVVFVILSILARVRFWDEVKNHYQCLHVVLPLWGRFKGDAGEGFHFVDILACTNSGLKVGTWVSKRFVFEG